MYSKYLYKGSIHEAGYDSMLTAIAFLKLATHLDEGKLPRGKRGRLEDIKLGLASSYTSAVQYLFPSRGPTPDIHFFMNFFDTRADEKMDEPLVQVDEPAVQVDELAMQMALPALADTRSMEINTKVQRGVLIPRLGSPFWHIYGNKLRIFGAIEKFAYFGAIEKPAKIKAMKKTECVEGNSRGNDENQLVQVMEQLICLD